MFAKRAYLLETSGRLPGEAQLRQLIDRLSLCRYNELYFYRRAASKVKPPAEKLFRYAEIKGISASVIDEVGLVRLRADGTAVASTEAPRSLAGRLEAMREGMAAAEAEARRRGCGRFLVADFSDGYDWQPPIVSLPGLVLGGYYASVGTKAAKIDLERELTLFLDAPLAGTLLKLGTLYLRGGALRPDASEYFNILAGDCGYSRHPGLTGPVLEEVSVILRGVMKEAERHLPRSASAKEILYAALLMDAACNRRNEARLRSAREEHARMWKACFEPDGRAESLARLPRF